MSTTELRENDLESVSAGKDVADSARRALASHERAMNSVRALSESASAKTDHLYGEAKAFIDALKGPRGG